MKATHIIHAAGPKFQEEDLEKKLRETMTNSLRAAETAGISQVAFSPRHGHRFLRHPAPCKRPGHPGSDRRIRPCSDMCKKGALRSTGRRTSAPQREEDTRPPSQGACPGDGTLTRAEKDDWKDGGVIFPPRPGEVAPGQSSKSLPPDRRSRIRRSALRSSPCCWRRRGRRAGSARPTRDP